MSSFPSKTLRAFIIHRAGNKCEYCRIPKLITNIEFHIEHIIALQHGGLNTIDNLAYSCPFCNWKKGPNIGTFVTNQTEIIPLFHPRKQDWFEHFDTNGGLIIPKTIIGIGTSNLLEFNNPERIEIRAVVALAGLFP